MVQGNLIQCTASTTIGLDSCGLFAIEDFVPHTNKEEYRVSNNNSFKVKFDGKIELRKSSLLSNEYGRYPLVKVHIDDMKPTRNTSLIGKCVII